MAYHLRRDNTQEHNGGDPSILSMDLLNFAVGASQCSLTDNRNMLTEWAWPLWRKAAVRSQLRATL
jgi:hypothetical protein